MRENRTLRLAPQHVMTGDLLSVGSDRRKAKTWDVVTWLDRANGNRGWHIETLTHGGAYYSNPRRVTVKRSGPKGLGEA